MHCQENLDFIRQALIDFGGTLPASARIAYDQVAQEHFDAVAAALAKKGPAKKSFKPAGKPPRPDPD